MLYKYKDLYNKDFDELNELLNNLTVDNTVVFAGIRSFLEDNLPIYLPEHGYKVGKVDIYGFEFERPYDNKTITIRCGYFGLLNRKFQFEINGIYGCGAARFCDDNEYTPYFIVIGSLLSDANWIRMMKTYLEGIYSTIQDTYDNQCLVRQVIEEKNQDNEVEYNKEKSRKFHEPIIEELKKADKNNWVCITTRYSGYSPMISYRGSAVSLISDTKGNYVSDTEFGFSLDSSKKVVQVKTLKLISDGKWINH